MVDINKEKFFLEITAGLVKFYTFVAHSVRIMTEPSPSGQITLQQMGDQLREIRTELFPKLDKSPVVMKKIENDYQKTMARVEAFKKLGSQIPASERERFLQDAIPLQAYAQEKSGSLSDLVAIFRSL